MLPESKKEVKAQCFANYVTVNSKEILKNAIIALIALENSKKIEAAQGVFTSKLQLMHYHVMNVKGIGNMNLLKTIGKKEAHSETTGSLPRLNPGDRIS